jgi:hypothetical protein
MKGGDCFMKTKINYRNKVLLELKKQFKDEDISFDFENDECAIIVKMLIFNSFPIYIKLMSQNPFKQPKIILISENNEDYINFYNSGIVNFLRIEYEEYMNISGLGPGANWTPSTNIGSPINFLAELIKRQAELHPELNNLPGDTIGIILSFRKQLYM